MKEKTDSGQNRSDPADPACSAQFQNSATPEIPDEVYASLPTFLKKVTEPFDDLREKDVVLLGALGLLSGVMPAVYGIYGGSKVYANLNLLVTAPAASGKGRLSFVRAIGEKLHRKILDKSVYARNLFKEQHPRQKLKEEDLPPLKTLFIPANSSATAIVLRLKANCGWGIMLEPEADTLTDTFTKEWGTYSDIARKAFTTSRSL